MVEHAKIVVTDLAQDARASIASDRDRAGSVRAAPRRRYIPSAAAARDRRPQTPATYNRAEFFQISGEQMKDLTDEERARLARQISSTQSAIWLDPAAIDDVILVGAGAAVVGGEEEDDAGDVVRHELALKALALHDFGLTVGRQPQILLPLGHDPSGQDGIGPHAVRPKIAGERTG